MTFARDGPASGTEGDYHIGDNAGEGRALFDATEEGCCDSAVLCGNVNGEVGDAFGEEFDVAACRESFKDEGEELEFECNAIKEFFFVFI